LIASPHPLDFDWRFDEATVAALYELVRGRNVLALGTPSVARCIEAKGGHVLLVDRQPFQNVCTQLVAEVPTLDLSGGNFDVAIVDAPWYPRDLVDWVSAGARAVRSGGEVLASAWPPETRPGAADELSRAMAEFHDWARVAVLPNELHYEAPPFELVASSISGNAPLASSPRRGCLIRLEVRERPRRPKPAAGPLLWRRFYIDGYQIGVRLGPSTAARSLVLPHADAKGWLWPYVSARAPGRDRIGVWSSEGEVAQVGDPTQLISILQGALNSPTASAFEAALAAVPELIAWKIPRPPYHRVLEWQHP
jgi:hypothetical protein